MQHAYKQSMLLPTRLSICPWLVSVGAPASAQVLVANDDIFAIPYGLPLEVEVFGVLDNDEFDGENAGESGAIAQGALGHAMMPCLVSACRLAASSRRRR